MNTDAEKPAKQAPIWGLIFASAIAGGASAFSMAPHFYWPLLLIGLASLFVIQFKLIKPWHSFLSGWLFGFFYFAFSLSWIGNALLVDGNEYAWAWPLAVTGLPALLAFFPAIASYAAKRFIADTPTQFYLGLAALLSLSELARGFLFTGFPWNLFGYSWGNSLEMLQIIHFGNMYWLSALTIFWGLGFGYIGLHKQKAIPALIIILISLTATYGYGHHRLSNPAEGKETDISFKLVQPSVEQSEKWQREKMPEHFSTLLQLSMPDGSEKKTTIIVWPETATNYLFLNDEFAKSQINNVLQSYEQDVYLLIGAFLRDDDGLPSNSMLILNKDGEIIHRYNKSHLVPFGEYIPFKEWIPIETVSGFSGFKRGEGRTSISLTDDFSFSPLICYEILFPSRVVNADSHPSAIINITNDAWYGISAGPHQHYLLAKTRAIEESIPVIRVANTGFSGIFDAYGNELTRIPLYEKNVATVNYINFSIVKNKIPFENAFLLIAITLLLLGLILKRKTGLF